MTPEQLQAAYNEVEPLGLVRAKFVQELTNLDRYGELLVYGMTLGLNRQSTETD